MNSPQEKSFFYEINFIRALACLMIVMVHVSAQFAQANGGDFTTYTYFWNQITRFGTPIFAVIGGFLLFNQYRKRDFILSRFASSRITKVLFPFLFWSVFYIIYKDIAGLRAFPNLGTPGEIIDFVYIFVRGETNYHLYFMSVVLQFYIIFPFLIMAAKSFNRYLVLFILAFAVNFLLVRYHPEIGNSYVDMIISERSFLFRWIFFFMIGGMLSYFWGPIMKWVAQYRRTSLSIGLLIFIFGALEYAVQGFVGSNRESNFFNIPMLFLAGASLYLFCSRLPRLQHAVISLGNLSLGIYLIHPFVLFVSNDYLSGLYTNAVWLPFSYALVLAGSIALVLLINKLPYSQYIITVPKQKQ
ncbi:peptidoglycan/LPS O-acetylase OafA/YrhL [Sinobaca qinghaiensis]|uniref:Peptidoglycan/LPS O-acetylase OafA/YrhL n=1 Tax=Sinobaca qinghaiensis TaxID=342944 RepID=A0A419V941_9BACL|nr:acyltransferase [Sinobaca qinghaiensis]RKD76498.1 peptidoglycan/LPS O-acetylase OafA/YrhL [Sinobaca qinghaiensis]